MSSSLALQARRSSATLHVERRPLAGMASLRDAWRDLAARAAEPNVFYEPDFALAAAAVFGDGVEATTIWSNEEPRRLLGVFPARRTRGMSIGWTHPYAPLGTPLVDADNVGPVVGAWLNALGRDVALLPLLPTAGPVAVAIAAAAMRVRDFAMHGRALLEPGALRSDYLATALGPKNRKELPRKRRRLAEQGRLEHRTNLDLDAFFAIEASGWKGRAGTAAAGDQRIQSFMTEAVALLGRRGQAQVDLLTLDAKPIAAMVTLRSRSTLFSWKIAYDESYARFSPGTQLVIDTTEAMLADPYLARIDSCAQAQHPMIDHVWRERLLLADRMVARDADPMHFTALGAVEALRRAAITNAKALRDRLKG